MTHWTDYSLRGWLSFLAFMHAGMAMRSYFDVHFVYGKIYSLADRLSHSNYEQREPFFVRLYAIYSLTQAFVLVQAAIHLYIRPVQLIAIWMSTFFVSIILLESFFYHTVDFSGGSLLIFSINFVTLGLLITFHYIWKPWLEDPISDETSLKMLFTEGKKKVKLQQVAAAVERMRAPRSSRHSLNMNEFFNMQNELMTRKKML